MRIELEEKEVLIEQRPKGQMPYLIKTGTYSYLVGSFAELVETLKGLFGIEEEE